MGRALGGQSREHWQIATGSVSDQLEPHSAMQNPYDVFFIRMSYDATPPEESTQHTARTRQQGVQCTDLTLNEASIMRRAAVVYTMLQTSVQLSLCCVQQLVV